MAKKMDRISRKISEYLDGSKVITEEKVISIAFEMLINQIGEMNDLDTESKNLIVDSINELVVDVNALETDLTNINNAVLNIKTLLVNKLKSKNVLTDISLDWEEIINSINLLELPVVNEKNIFEFTVSSGDTLTLINDLRGDTTTETIYTDWGDGTVDTELTHTYANAGVYIVTTKYCIQGTGSTSTNDNTKAKLTNVYNINTNITTAAYMFYKCINLTVIVGNDWDTSNITDMTSMFEGCSNLVAVYMDTWDVSNVTLIDSMFSGCKMNF